MSSQTEVSAYPWQSDSVYAAELDAQGLIRRTNPALSATAGDGLEGMRFSELLATEQRTAFDSRLAELGDAWECLNFGFCLTPDGGAEDRCVWLHRRGDGMVEVYAEPAFGEHRRLVEQVLQLNDDLISTQRSVSRRQRDLESAQGEAARAERRVRQLEGILLAGLTPRDFDEALRSLLEMARSLLPGDRAGILLADETAGRLVLRASTGVGLRNSPLGSEVPVGEGVLGSIASTGRSVLIDDLAAAEPDEWPAGSLIGTPLQLDGQVIGVMAISTAEKECFSQSDLRLLELVGERVALAIGQAQLREREQRMAETLQMTLLPQTLPRVPGVDVAARYRAHTASVGGDFYDALALPGGRVGVAIGDVTGKGLRAAATMSRLRSALHAYALDSRSAAEVLHRLSVMADADGALATALYLVLDPRTGAVEIASAGHLPPIHLTAGQGRYVDVSPALAPPLGLPAQLTGHVNLELEVGGSLLLYTDGLVEGSRDIDDGMRRLLGAAIRDAEAPVAMLCENLVSALAPEVRYRDDMAVLAVRRTVHE